MAFGKSKEDILKELFPGKTEEELKQMISSFDSVKAKADKVDKLEQDFALANTELATTRQKLIELEDKNKNTTTTTTTITDEKPDWGVDADAAFLDRSKPLAAMTLETRAEVVYDRVVNNLMRTDPYFLNEKLRKEFDDLIKQEKNPAVRANQMWVENVWLVVFARHRTEIMRDFRAGSGDYFVESGRNQNNNTSFNDNRPDPSKTLTEEEKREAAKFGVSPEKWLETRNKIKFVGGGVQIS